MAGPPAAPTPRPPKPELRLKGPGVVTVSISLSLLLIAPLCWYVVVPVRQDSQLKTASKQHPVLPVTLPNPPAEVAPIAGEVLVRFEPSLAVLMQAELERTNRPFGIPLQPQENLIGARLPGEQVGQAVPQLLPLLSRFEVWAADAIDPQAGRWRLKLSEGADPLQVAALFHDWPGVLYAEPDYPVYALAREPNDPFYVSRNQSPLRAIGAPEAWDITTGSDRVTIAVLDTGLAYAHSELRNKIAPGGRNFVSQPANDFAWDDNGHGTYVAGIAAADSNNGEGMAGVAWGARLLSVKVLDYNYQGTIATLAMGLAYVTTQPVQVVNMSTGGPVRSRILEESAQKAFDKGLVLVAAAGNSGKQEMIYPAAFDTVIAVGASDETDRPAPFSTYGPYLSLIAPGATNILSLFWANDRDYAQTNGTSASSPFVAGTVALMLSANPRLTNRQVRNILEGTAYVPPGSAAVTGTPLPGRNPDPTPAQTIAPTPTPTPIQVTAPTALPAVSTRGAISASSLGTLYNVRSGWGRLDVYQAVLAARNGEVFPSRRTVVTGVVLGVANPLDFVLSLENGDRRYPDAAGRYEFTSLPPGTYRLEATSSKYNVQAAIEFTVNNGEGGFIIHNFDFTSELAAITGSGQAVAAFQKLNLPPAGDEVIYFPESKHSLRGPFKEFWETRGKIPVFGLPISEEFEENGLTVQYFERAVLEYHTEYARTRSEVQPRLLGSLAAQNRPDPAFIRLAPPGKPQPDTPERRYFDQTGHTLSVPFRAFWEANGGLALFGYPVSEPFLQTDASGKQRLTQFFERCRMDYFPEYEGSSYSIQLGLLALESARANRLLGKP